MFPINKDILLMISVACALIAIFYLYKDVQKTKLDVQKLSDSGSQAVLPMVKQPALQKKPAPPTPSPDDVADDSN
jgi:hypothetical protein